MRKNDSGEKRRRRGKQRKWKLIPGEKVEVLCLDEGLLGAWHQGQIFAARNNYRIVTFDELLSDDGSSKLVEYITVSDAINGEDRKSEMESVEQRYRGRIRPLPPAQGVIKCSEFAYGLCVDVLADDAWWEGVICDHNEDSETRLVFYPDQGDRKAVRINSMRVTHDWNEVSGAWQIRGKWLLLLVLQEFEKTDALPVSVRQIWYDLRTTSTYIEEIGEWFMGSEKIWRLLVANFIEEVLCVVHGLPIVDELPTIESGDPQLHIDDNCLNCSKLPLTGADLIPINDCSSSMACSTLYCASSEVIRFGALQELSVSSGCKESVAQCSMENDLGTLCRPPINQPHPLAMELDFRSPCSSSKDKCGDLIIKSHYRIHEISGEENLIPSNAFHVAHGNFTDVVQEGEKLSFSHSWKSVDLEPENCPQVIALYAQFLSHGSPKFKGSENGIGSLNELRVMLKKHLLFLGWKVDTKRDKKALRVRFTSPKGRSYFRYSTAFRNLVGESHVEQEYKGQFSQFSANQQLNRPSGILLGNELEVRKSIDIDDFEEGFKTTSNYSIPSEKEFKVVSNRKRKLPEPRYSRESIVEYVRYIESIKKRQMRVKSHLDSQLLRLNALRHVLFMGWIYSYHRKNGKKIDQYCSPSGEYYRSLYTACKECLCNEKNTAGSKDMYSAVQATSRSFKEQTCILELEKSPLTNSSLMTGSDFYPLVVHHLNNEESNTPFFLNSSESVPFEKLNLSLKRSDEHGKSKRRKITCSLHGQHNKIGIRKMMQPRFVRDLNRPRLKSDSSLSESDSLCSICHYGGELILCENCPSTYHIGCVGLKAIPDGKWFCSPCRCSLCGLSDFNSDINEFTVDTIIYCDQCVRQYHVGCWRKQTLRGLRSCPVGNWFCSKQCSKMFNKIRKMAGKIKATPRRGLKWTIFGWNKKDDSADGKKLYDNPTLNFPPMLLRALDVLHECFLPMIDSRNQRDLIADLLSNKESELNRLNFRGFYAMLLLKGDELISVAAFRVFDERVAEAPLIGTRIQDRQKGMCRLLMNELEKFLSGLGVQKLLLPAVAEHLETWKNSFGFTELSSSDRLRLSEFTLVNFQDAVMLQKILGMCAATRHKPKGKC